MGMENMFGWLNKTHQINRRAMEMSGAYDGGLAAVTHGMMAGTHVASNLGWRPVEALAAGDMVLTFDHGMQQITDIQRATVCIDAPDTAPALWPVVVPIGALGNREELTLLADQGVLVESDAAYDIYGDPFAIVRVAALEGVRGIHRRAPVARIELVVIHFACEQVVYAEGGALIHCPLGGDIMDMATDAPQSCYDVLPVQDAAHLVECLVMEDQMLATGGRHRHETAVH